MLRNYLKVALRNLKRRPGYTAINIIGLAVGLACCLLLFLFVRSELSYDDFHAKSDRVYRVLNEKQREGKTEHLAVTPPPLAPTLERELPAVQEAVRFYTLQQKQLVEQGQKKAFESDFLLADPSVFELFGFSLKRGNPKTALQEPNSVVLTEEMAAKYFPNENPLGKTLTVGTNNDYTVTGVMEDLPEETHFNINFLGSFATLEQALPQERIESWGWQQFFTYLQLPEGYDAEQLEAAMADLVASRSAEATRKHGFTYDLYLQPLADVYLHSAGLQFDWIAEKGSITYVWAFSITGFLILLIACFNFMNLSTARSVQRAKEVGMRKALGARRGQIAGQFLTESMLLTLFALGTAVGLARLALPVLNDFAGSSLAFGASAGWVGGLLCVCLVVGVLAGSYPALYLSGFEPTAVLRGSGTKGGTGGLTRLRRSLVVVQFAISIALMIATGVVFQQLQYTQSKKLGFEKEQIVTLPLRTPEQRQRYEAFKQNLTRHSAITAAAASYGVPGGTMAGDGVRRQGGQTNTSTRMMLVDHDFLDTYGMEMAAGRGFSEQFGRDREHAFLLNRAAARQLGWSPEEAVGKRLEWDEWESDSVKTGEVVGVTENFHFRSLHRQVEPLVMHIYPEAFSSVSVRIKAGATEEALAHVESVWQEWVPSWPFEYSFLDAEFASMYRAEQKLGQVFAVFSGLAVLIACLGLFGLAAFAAEQRTKEIGVRKALGASVGNIVGLLSKDFLKLVGLAFVMAVPVAWYAMRRWLETFAYRTDLGPWLFAAVGAAALALALLTVSYHALRAARTNPAHTLRNE